MNRTTLVLAATIALAGCPRRDPNAAMNTNSAPLTGMAAVPVSADHCPTAPVIAAPVTLTGTLIGAVSDSNDRIAVTGYTWAGRDHFFAIDLQAGQPLTLSLVEQGWDGGIYIFQNCAAIAATTVAGRDTSAMRPLTFTAPAAGRYLIAVDAWQPNTGAGYTLTVTPGITAPVIPGLNIPMPPIPLPQMPTIQMPPTPPPVVPVMPPTAMGPAIPAMPIADSCMTAQPVPVPSTVTGDLTNATADSNARIEVSHYAWAGRDHFFALILTAGQHVRLNLTEAGWDGGLYIFRDCANIPGSVVAGRDTTSSTPLDFVAPATGRYILAVDAYVANTGSGYTLTISP